MKKILITGSNGFIGKNLAEYLADKFQIYCPKRIELDLTDDKAVNNYLSRHCFDVVIHSATHNATVTSTQDVNLVLDTNLKMFFNLEKSKDLYGKMLYFGSGAEFDRDSYIPKMKEEYFGKNIPKDHYGFSKYIMAKVAEGDNNIYNLRLFGVYGRYEDWKIRFISNNICRGLFDLSFSINQNVFFDYLYIDDLCRLTEWFIHNKPRNKTYNVCTGISIDLYSIAKEIQRISKRDLPIIVKEEGFKREYSGCNIRLLKEVGDFKFSHFAESIEKLHKWYEVRISKIDENSEFLR